MNALRKPRALQTFGFGMIGRMPLAMNPVGIVLLIAKTRDSYAVAGIASASYTLAGAIFGPRFGQLADRFGTRRVILPIAAINFISILALIHFSHSSTPAIALCAASAGATLPNIGSYTRTRWSRALQSPQELGTALSIEAVLDEIAFVTGPALAGILYGWRSPAFAMKFALGFLVVGSLGIALSASHHDISENRERRIGGLLRIPDMKALLLSLTFLGVVFGGNTVAILASAKLSGHESSGGILVALYSIGSLVAGTLYGLRHWKSDPGYRFAVALAFMTCATSGLLFLHHYSTLAWLVALSGLAISPTLIAANAFAKELVPPDRLNEAFAYLGAAISLGITIGSFTVGLVVNHFGAWQGFDVVTAAAALSTAIAVYGVLDYRKGHRHGK